MKRTSFYLIALLCMSLATASCTKEEQFDNGVAPKFTASIVSNAKTEFNPTDGLVWSSTDQVVIFGSAGRSVYDVTPENNPRTAQLTIAEGQTSPGNPNYTAIYPVSVATTSNVITLPDEQVSVSGELTGNPMYAYPTSNYNLKFKNLCSVLKIHMQKDNTSISKIQIISNKFINGDFLVGGTSSAPTLTIDHSVTDITDHNPNKHKMVTTLTFTSGNVSIANGNDFYVYLPADTYSKFEIKVYDNNGNIFIHKANSAITLNRSQYHNVTIPTDVINFNPGDLKGEFSVAAGRKVSFARGNLLSPSATSTSYKFADNQYDITNTDYTNYLFTWAGDNNQTMNQRNTNISNGAGSTWNVLTQAEWDYLLKSPAAGGRSVTYHHWTLVSVTKSDGTSVAHGMLLFPDAFDWPLEKGRQPKAFDISSNFNNHTWTGTDTNTTNRTYTYDEWCTLEAAGCVFLPITGYKSSSNGSITQSDYGYYWSRTPFYPSGNDRSYAMRFWGAGATFASSHYKNITYYIAIRHVKYL